MRVKDEYSKGKKGSRKNTALNTSSAEPARESIRLRLVHSDVRLCQGKTPCHKEKLPVNDFYFRLGALNFHAFTFASLL